MSAKKWLGLTAIAPATAMTFLDQSILPVALPTIQNEMNVSNIALQWSISIYLLALAVFVLIGGKIADLIGYRLSYMIAMILFTIASLFCGFSDSIVWLNSARGVQGIGAALLIPAGTGLLTSVFAPHERGKAIGINVSIGSIFLILGPLIGGFLTEELSWRWIFWINFPIAIAGLIFVNIFIPACPPHKQKIDLLGFICFAISACSLAIVVMQGRAWGWASLRVLSLIALFIISGFLLFWRERRAEHPFLDLTLFKHPIYRASNLSVGSVQFMLMITVYWAIFFQQTLHYTPLKAGWITFFSSVPTLFMAPIAGVSDRFNPKLPVAIGFIFLIFSSFWIAFFIQSSLALLLIGLIAFGIGIPFILTPSFSSAINSVPPTKIGTASGTLSTVRFFSGTLGVAIIGSFFEFMTNRSMIAGKDLEQSHIEGFFSVNVALAVLLILAFGAVFVLYRRKSTHHLPESPGEGWD